MNKFRSLIFVLAGILLMTGISFAAENQVEITGTAFGVNTHLLHLDYSTATRPTSTADDSRFDNASFYAGPTKQFYIPVTDPDFSVVGPGDSDFVASISTFTDDCDEISGCLLKGYIWSDVVGWIVLDGSGTINPAITDPNDGGVGDVYTPDMYPRIKSSGAVTGFAWNEKIGWIGFSSNLNNGTLQPAAAQTKDIWGVWLDISAALVIEDMGTPADSSDDILIGRPFRGFAWSEKLGWIKFQIEGTDTFDFNFGAMTTWVPDDTPPNILSPSTVWFATGVNTGYIAPAEPTTIVWDSFVADQESGILSSEEGSKITIETIGDAACESSTPFAENVSLATYSDTEYKVGELTIPNIGRLGMDGDIPPKGFCKYKLTAKILNGIMNPLYIGDTYVPPCDDYVDEPACNADPDAACNWTGVCEHKVEPNMAPGTDPNGVIIYVRAGNFDLTQSTVILSPKTNGLDENIAIADGRDFVEYEIAFKDLAGNPIVDIDCSTPDDPVGTNPQFEYADCPERDVTINANAINQAIYDLTQPPDPLFDPTPILYSDDSVFTTGTPLFKSDDEASDDIKDGIVKLEVYQPPGGGNINLTHQIEFASYAPSSTYTQASDYGTEDFRRLKVDFLDYEIDDDSLPATNLIEFPPDSGFFIDDPASVTPANNETGVLVHGDADFPSTEFTFLPPITTSNGTLVSGGVNDVLTLSVPADVSFSINNISDNAIAQDGNGGLSIDNVFQYYSPSWSATLAVMETQRIKNTTAGDPDDGKLAWSDPFQVCSYCTRYEWYDGEHFTTNELTPPIPVPDNPLDAEDSVFHAFFQLFNPVIDNPPDPAKFMFDWTAESTIEADGTYAIIGRESIPYEHAYEGLEPPDEDYDDQDNWDEDGEIDRSDPANLELTAVDGDTPSITKEIQFTPEKYIPVTIDDIDLRLIHEIGYRFANQPFFSVYAQSPVLSGIQVKDIGVEAVGTVAGEEIVTGREFDIVSTASTRKLQEQIRRNAAELIASIDAPCSIPVNPLANPLTEFPTTPGGCVVEDTVNGTIFAYYKGSAGEELVIGDGIDDVTAPALPYTLIVKGGADVFIQSNIIYDDPVISPRSSLGIIVIAENIGDGANVYMSPVPTNIVGTMYMEGSLLSRNTNPSPVGVYYGGGGGNIQDLSSQLYWQGSIASRNTIAGAGLSPPKAPEGATCLAGDTALSCAQRYDFDYLRRFTAVTDDPVTPTVSEIASDGLFSGGGCCSTGCSPAITPGTCQYGAGTLDTKVVLTGDQIDVTESELAPFFIEKDPRTLSLPPPGFTLTGGFESIQEIR